MSVFSRKRSRDFRLFVGRVMLLSVTVFLSVSELEAQTWYKKRVWYAQQDSVPVYEDKKIGSRVVTYIVGKGRVIDLRLSYDSKWLIVPKRSGSPGGFIPVSVLGTYLEGVRNYEVVLDSVVGTVEVVYSSWYEGLPLSVSQTFYKGDVIRLNRAYPDYYANYFSVSPADISYAFLGKIDKEALVPTEVGSTVKFTVPKEMVKTIREHHKKYYKELTAAKKNVAGTSWDIRRIIIGIVLGFIIIVCIVGFYYLNVRVLRRYLFDRSKSNVSISGAMMIGSGVLMYIAGQCLWILADGFLAFLLVVICVLLFFAALYHTESRLQRRCAKCNIYNDLSFLGMTKDGTKWEYDHQSDSVTTRYWEGDTLVEERVDRNQWFRRQYQIYAFNYKCRQCGHTWKVRYKGGLITSEKRTLEETEETRFK
ncbi:hypothetical protein [Gabonibacter massiliensis]|uniref:hypothetical protein n=1 Tax=Gabonibacter massiliensis TaxID=1720195 RepID=UPI0011CBFC5C|nr:hypothetical protein [Gabonibacter massiliensis]